MARTENNPDFEEGFHDTRSAYGTEEKIQFRGQTEHAVAGKTSNERCLQTPVTFFPFGR